VEDIVFILVKEPVILEYSAQMGSDEEAMSGKRNNVPELGFISELKRVKDRKMEHRNMKTIAERGQMTIAT
jgi:hypothetical protein